MVTFVKEFLVGVKQRMAEKWGAMGIEQEGKSVRSRERKRLYTGKNTVRLEVLVTLGKSISAGFHLAIDSTCRPAPL